MLNRRRLLLASLCASSVLVGCDSGDELNGQDVVIETPDEIVTTAARAVTLTVADASTGALVSDSVTLTFNGALASSLKDAQGNAVSSLVVVGGMAQLYTAGTGDLVVVAQRDGFLTGGTTVTLADSDSLQVGAISLVNVAAPPAGVEIITATTSATGGAVAESLAISVPASGGSEPVTVSVPAGTVLTTASGVALSGAITAVAASVDLTSADAQATLPGDNAVDGAPVELAAITELSLVDASGNEAAALSQPIQASLAIAASSTDPVSGAAYASGDTVGVYSLSSSAGEWVYEGNTVLQQDDAGDLVAPISITHLSYWAVGKAVATCSSPMTLSFPTLDGVNAKISFQRTGYLLDGQSLGATSLQLSSYPVGRALNFKVEASGETLVEDIRSLACGEAVTISQAPSVQTVSETFNVFGACSEVSGSSEALPGVAVNVTRNGAYVTSVRSGTNGQAVASGLVSGQTYGYSADLGDGQVLTGSFVAGGSTVLEGSFTCVVATGSN